MNQLHTSQFTLQSFGYLLQRIHFAKYMQGYHVYLLQDGTISSQSFHPIARITLTKSKITLLSYKDNVSVGPNLLNKDDELDLDASLSIIYNNVHFLFIPHPEKPVSGWPYRAEIQTKATPINISFLNKSLIRIGRKSSCDIVLPSHSNNDNIIWKNEFKDTDSVPTGSGFTHKSRFSTDTIMVSTEHAGIRHENGHFVLQNIGKNCSCFIRRDDSIFALIPPTGKEASSEPMPENITLQNSDLLYIGNRLFRVQLNLQRNEPHLDPSRFIHEAFPTHIDGASPTTSRRQPSEPESLAAQAKRFFSPKSHPSEQDSVFPDPIEDTPIVNSPSSNDQETALPLGAPSPKPRPTTPLPRPSNRHSPLSQVNPQSEKTLSLIEPVPDAASNAAVDIPEYSWELSLSSSHQIRLHGWLIKGSQRLGNSNKHDIVVPENRIQASQFFPVQDYCTIHYRRGTNEFTAHDSPDLIVDSALGQQASQTTFHIIRRGIHGAEDFRIRLSPNVNTLIPNSMTLSLDRQDETVASMFTQDISPQARQIPFRFSASDIRCSVQNNELLIETAHEIRMVRIDLKGMLHSHDRSNPLRIRPNERAIVGNCIIQWFIPS